MRISRFLWCTVTRNHAWVRSKKQPGYKTCTRCGVRKFRSLQDPAQGK